MWVAGTSEGSNESQVACARTQSIEEFLVKLRSSMTTAKTKSPCSVCHPGDGVGHVAGMLTNTGYHRCVALRTLLCSSSPLPQIGHLCRKDDHR